MKSISVLMLIFSVLITFGVGCQIAPEFDVGYKTSDDMDLADLKNNKSVAVVKFEDARPPKFQASMSRLFWLYIPLVPFINIPHERMDEIVDEMSVDIQKNGPGPVSVKQPVAPSLSVTSFPCSMAMALADDLKLFFGSSNYLSSAPSGWGGYDYVLKGQLKEALINSWTTSYCLGIAGILNLWVFGIPIGGFNSDVEIDFLLEDRQGKKVWKGTLNGSASRIFTLYNDAMVYGRGAFPMNVLPCEEGNVESHSLFAWAFAALANGMQETRIDILEAIQDDLDRKSAKSKVKEKARMPRS